LGNLWPKLLREFFLLEPAVAGWGSVTSLEYAENTNWLGSAGNGAFLADHVEFALPTTCALSKADC